uniref:Polyamine modulated factor 1 n=1 Tax=Dromaius novaehollandiae TaxID=8790 RepID=A0A8C4PB04_DRONO
MEKCTEKERQNALSQLEKINKSAKAVPLWCSRTATSPQEEPRPSSGQGEGWRSGARVGAARLRPNPRVVLRSQEEIQEVKEEGNLEALFNSLDKIVEEAKEQEEPAWRPSGIPEEDVRSAMVPYLLKHRAYLRKVLKEKEEENRKLAEAVLAGRDRIAELQRLIQDRKQAWQVKPSHLCAEAASV